MSMSCREFVNGRTRRGARPSGTIFPIKKTAMGGFPLVASPISIVRLKRRLPTLLLVDASALISAKGAAGRLHLSPMSNPALWALLIAAGVMGNV